MHGTKWLVGRGAKVAKLRSKVPAAMLPLPAKAGSPCSLLVFKGKKTANQAAGVGHSLVCKNDFMSKCLVSRLNTRI